MSAEAEYKAIPSTLITDSTVAGRSFLTLADPGAVTFPRINADNTVTARSAADFRTDIGAGTGSGDALTANPLSQFAATTSLQLLGVISDETGSGALVFGTSPTIVTPVIAKTQALQNGSSSDVALGWAANTGFYKTAGNTLTFCVGGTDIFTSASSGIFSTIGTAKAGSGSLAVPSWGFNAEGNLGVNRISAGTMQLVANAVAQATITSAGIQMGAAIRLKGYTVATLPVGVQGDSAFVTNALAPTYGTAVVGGGAVIVPVFYDGTNWVCT